MINLGRYRKTIVALVGLVVVALATLLPDQWAKVGPIIVSFLTMLGVYQAKNEV